MSTTERLLALMDEVTERLRALLDERGAEWWETASYIGATITSEGIERHYLVSTWWNSPVFGRVEATDMGDGVLHMACLNGRDLTPEQAIAATLGAGTCHDKNGFDPDTGFECTVCGTMVDSYMITPADMGHEEQFHYCPSCGRELVWV